MIPDLVFAYLMDYLTPLDYEGGALARHPQGDPSRRIDRALAAEVLSAAALLERLAGSVLMPLRELLSRSDARDVLALLVQRAALVPIGLLPNGETRDALRRLRDALADARRAHRWLAGVGPLVALRASAPLHGEQDLAGWALAVVAQVASFWAIATDHARWLQQHRLIPGALPIPRHHALSTSHISPPLPRSHPPRHVTATAMSPPYVAPRQARHLPRIQRLTARRSCRRQTAALRQRAPAPTGRRAHRWPDLLDAPS